LPDVGQKRAGPPENFISWMEVFGDPMTMPLSVYRDPAAREAHFWDHLRSLGLKPENYEVTQSVQWYGWLLHRKRDG
jgi:hypothetical protein